MGRFLLGRRFHGGGGLRGGYLPPERFFRGRLRGLGGGFLKRPLGRGFILLIPDRLMGSGLTGPAGLGGLFPGLGRFGGLLLRLGGGVPLALGRGLGLPGGLFRRLRRLGGPFSGLGELVRASGPLTGGAPSRRCGRFLGFFPSLGRGSLRLVRSCRRCGRFLGLAGVCLRGERFFCRGSSAFFLRGSGGRRLAFLHVQRGLL